MSETKYPVIVQVFFLFLIVGLFVMNVYVIYRLAVADKLSRYDAWVGKADTNLGQLNVIVKDNFNKGKLDNPLVKPGGKQ